jgi:hypothetical protein
MTLLIIDFPDERIPPRWPPAQHMHAWGTSLEMYVLKRLLEDQLGSLAKHAVIEATQCPHCNALEEKEGT